MVDKNKSDIELFLNNNQVLLSKALEPRFCNSQFTAVPGVTTCPRSDNGFNSRTWSINRVFHRTRKPDGTGAAFTDKMIYTKKMSKMCVKNLTKVRFLTQSKYIRLY